MGRLELGRRKLQLVRSALSVVLLLAAHSAVAQTNIAVGARSSVSAPFAPAGTPVSNGNIPFSLSLSVPALSGSVPLPSAPSLAVGVVPVAPSQSAVQAVHSVPAVSVVAVKAGEAAKINALTPTLPAASKADDVRAEVAKAIEEWRASKGAASGAKTPASGAVAAPESLDALFDGRVPTSSRVLARAGDLGLDTAALGLAISESKSVTEAAQRLEALGVLGPKEAALAAADEDGFRFLLTRLWRAAAPSVPGEAPVDASWSVPALKVVVGKTTFFVHGVTHGQAGAPRRGAVLRLARTVEKSGAALYSEQNLPAYYGYATGQETLDHASADGAVARLVPAAGGRSKGSLLAARAIEWLVSPGSALGALAWTLLHPAALLPWLILAGLSGFAWYMATGGLPLMRLKRRRRAAAAAAEGYEDIAAQYADEARNFFLAKPDLEVLRGLELPQPLGAEEGDAYSARSRAIADAVATDAAAAGAVEAHLIVGHLHAHEIAWRLAHPPVRKS